MAPGSNKCPTRIPDNHRSATKAAMVCLNDSDEWPLTGIVHVQSHSALMPTRHPRLLMTRYQQNVVTHGPICNGSHFLQPNITTHPGLLDGLCSAASSNQNNTNHSTRKRLRLLTALSCTNRFSIRLAVGLPSNGQ